MAGKRKGRWSNGRSASASLLLPAVRQLTRRSRLPAQRPVLTARTAPWRDRRRAGTEGASPLRNMSSRRLSGVVTRRRAVGLAPRSAWPGAVDHVAAALGSNRKLKIRRQLGATGLGPGRKRRARWPRAVPSPKLADLPAALVWLVAGRRWRGGAPPVVAAVLNRRAAIAARTRGAGAAPPRTRLSRSVAATGADRRAQSRQGACWYGYV